MTLDQIRIFVCVADLCHVTRAAARLNLTQSAVSAAISTLERTHDVRLFDRVGRTIVLTEAGHSLLAQARRLLAEAETTRAALASLAREPAGSLRIWASQTVASYWLAPKLMALHTKWPAITLAVHAANTHDVARAVQDGQADIGIVEGALPASDLVVRKVGQDELFLVLARSNPLARKPVWDRTDYLSLPWVLREDGSGTRAVTQAHLADMGLRTDDLTDVLELPTNEAILGAIGTGPFVSMMSWRAVCHARARGMAIRRITWTPRPVRDFSAITDPRRFRTRAVDAFLEILPRHRHIPD